MGTKKVEKTEEEAVEEQIVEMDGEVTESEDIEDEEGDAEMDISDKEKQVLDI